VDRKTLGRIELKAEGDASEGAFRSIFARFNVIDHDGDVTLPGAFPVGKTVPISAYGHRSHDGALPVGKGVIGETDEFAYIDGRFFLDTVAGADTYRTVKALTDPETGDAGQEWSYGYDVLNPPETMEVGGQRANVLRKLDVSEVSPVLLGAGIGTQLVAIKSHALPFTAEADTALAVVEAFAERAKALADLRAKEGRPLSIERRGQFVELIEAIDGFSQVRDELADLLAATDPDAAKAHAGRLISMRTRLALAEADAALAGGTA